MLLFLYISLFFFVLLSLFVIFSSLLVLFLFERRQQQKQEMEERKNLFERYSLIKNILDESKEIAYNKVYRENLLSHNTSEFRINDSLIEKYGKTYVELVFKCCGNSISKDLVKMFGDYDSLCIFLLTGFVNKLIEFEAQILAKSTDEDTEPEDIQKLFLNEKN